MDEQKPMKTSSIKQNSILNLVKTLMSLIFPLITYPYATRILLPEGIGKVTFATSIISYFALLASLGITSYGVREAAKVRDSREQLSRVAKELFTVNMAATVFSYAVLFAAMFVVPKFADYRDLLIVCSATILFTTLGMEWLYAAIEDFTYITVRSIAFQFISLILLFTFVHTKEDILPYAAISVVSNVGSNILNFLHARKFITFKGIHVGWNDVQKHIRPLMVLFIMAITSSIYTILDTSMLGFLTSDYEVGIYGAATKINRLVLNLVVSVGTVLLPRLSYYFGNDDKDGFYKLAYKSVDLLMAVAIPAAIGLSLLAEKTVLVISGDKFIEAVPVMRAINPLIMIVGLSNFIGVQMFMPLKKEKWTLYSDIAGAVMNLVLNFILISRFGALGAAIASLCAETTVTVIQTALIRRYLDVKIILKKVLYYLGCGAVMGVVVFVVDHFIDNRYIGLGAGIFAGVVTYCATLLLVKNEWALFGVRLVFGKLRRNHE